MKQILTLALLATPSVATAQVALVRPGPVQAIGPKQDDPLTCDGTGRTHKGGGRATGVAAGTTTIRGAQTPGGFNPETDPHAHGGAEGIGPKQDDPSAPGQGLAIGPKQDDPRTADSTGGGRGVAAPKGGLMAVQLPGRFNPETDPRAAGGGNGAVAIGPKQDDPSTPGQGLAIGPRQDDPTAPGARRATLAMSDTCGSIGQVPIPKPGK